MSKRGSAVWLRIYDLSNGKAATWSQLLLGEKIDGIWHTGIHVYDKEYFYGGGIECATSREIETTYEMEFVSMILLGYTQRTKSDFNKFLKMIDYKFNPSLYDLALWNCNHFTDMCSRFLLKNRGIPDEILELPALICKSFIGDILLRLFRKIHKNRNPMSFSPDNPLHPRHKFFYKQASRKRSLNPPSIDSFPSSSTSDFRSDHKSNTYDGHNSYYRYNLNNQSQFKVKSNSSHLSVSNDKQNEKSVSDYRCQNLKNNMVMFKDIECPNYLSNNKLITVSDLISQPVFFNDRNNKITIRNNYIQHENLKKSRQNIIF